MTHLPSLSKLKSKLLGQSGVALPKWFVPVLTASMKPCSPRTETLAVAAIGLCIRRLHPNGHSQNARACDSGQSALYHLPLGQQMREQATPVGSWRVDTAGRLCEGDSIIEDLDRDFNDIRVRSFILTGAPVNQ